MQDKFLKLKNYLIENDIKKETLSRVFELLKQAPRGERTENDPMQFPSFYIKDEKAIPWHHPYQYSWIKLLEENFEGIKKEAIQIFEENLMSTHPENNMLADEGTWNTFFFYKNGLKYIDNHIRCPFTSSLIKKIPGVEIAGRTYFSAMTPGIHIKPHCGPHNFKLRTHLGIITHKDAFIRVAHEIKSWIDGKCIVFDDSFEHEVWNKSKINRIVLIVDVWNPSLSPHEIKALELIMPEFYSNKK